MFKSKGLFSEIQCPYEETCVLPRCIFAHPKSSFSPLATGIKGSSRIQADGGVSERSSKRQKLDNEKDDLRSSPREAVKPAAFTGIRVTNEPRKDAAPTKGKRPSDSLTRSVSPPPIRRKIEDGKAIPVKQQTNISGSRTTSTSPTSTPTRPSAATKPPAKAVVKKEGLNPRPLKQAPAAHDMRFRLLRALHEQLKRLNAELNKDANHDEESLVLSEQAVITMALDLEEEAALQPTVYSNLVKNKVLLYKRMTVSQWKTERQSDLAKAKALQEASTLSKPKPTEKPKEITTGLTTAQEIAFLPRLLTPTTALKSHGYVNTIPTPSEIQTANLGVEASKGWEVCDRCKSRFQVFPSRRPEDGALATGGTCTYHNGKPFWSDASATDATVKKQKKWRCCGEVIGDSPGCTTAACHVFKITEVKRLAAILNFVETPKVKGKKENGPVCIDGEMGYTVHGLELIRLTATSWPSGTALFDVLVKPVGAILDLNTRFSGVHPEDYTTAPAYSSSAPPDNLQLLPSISDARVLLFSYLSPDTPLIGHGLENDLNATRVIHPTIIDTALLFPHKAGLPYRNGLKVLMMQYLGRAIQGGEHDSKEDANAAGMLVRWRVGEEWAGLRRRGWSVNGVKFSEGGEGGG